MSCWQCSPDVLSCAQGIVRWEEGARASEGLERLWTNRVPSSLLSSEASDTESLHSTSVAQTASTKRKKQEDLQGSFAFIFPPPGPCHNTSQQSREAAYRKCEGQSAFIVGALHEQCAWKGAEEYSHSPG